MQLSVIIPTYNPEIKTLREALAGLRKQSLPTNEWELIIVDNNSSNNFQHEINLQWHRSSKVVIEPKQGLTYARVRGFNESTGSFIVMVDDDNVLNSNYLEHVLSIMSNNPTAGAIGGKSQPRFENVAPDWLNEFYSSLALRDLGDNPIISRWNNSYPASAPIGAGMAIRRDALLTYINKITTGKSKISDRSGASLGSGGDNDIIIEILKSGWDVGYYPELDLQHIIPSWRTESDYLAKLIEQTNKSWVLLLESHDIMPWQPITKAGASIRKVKAWFSYSAWKNKAAYIKWRGACGLFDGRAILTSKR